MLENATATPSSAPLNSMSDNDDEEEQREREVTARRLAPTVTALPPPYGETKDATATDAAQLARADKMLEFAKTLAIHGRTVMAGLATPRIEFKRAPPQTGAHIRPILMSSKPVASPMRERYPAELVRPCQFDLEATRTTPEAATMAERFGCWAVGFWGIMGMLAHSERYSPGNLSLCASMLVGDDASVCLEQVAQLSRHRTLMGVPLRALETSPWMLVTNFFESAAVPDNCAHLVRALSRLVATQSLYDRQSLYYQHAYMAHIVAGRLRETGRLYNDHYREAARTKDMIQHMDQTVMCAYQLACLYKWLRHTPCHADVLRVVMDGYDFHIRHMYKGIEQMGSIAAMEETVARQIQFMATTTATTPIEYDTQARDELGIEQVFKMSIVLLAVPVTQRLSPAVPLASRMVLSTVTDAMFVKAFSFMARMAASFGWYYWRIGEACLYMEMARMVPDKARDVACFEVVVS
jgi:hypothetical protein